MPRRAVIYLIAVAALIVVPILLWRLGIVTLATIAQGFSAILSERSLGVEREVPYGSHHRQRLDIYRPKTGDGTGPIVMFLYGGGWKSGERETYHFVGAALAARGLTTVIPDYRLFPEVRFPTFVEDAALAYRWISRHLARGHDGERPIVLFGHSAGAHIGALLAFNRRYLRAADPNATAPAAFVGLAGPYAFDPTTWPSTKDVFATATKADLARPIAFVAAGAPPSLLLHGLDDTVVRLWNARSMQAALSAAGVEVRKVELPDIGHIGILTAIARPLRWRAPVLTEVIAFIRGHEKRRRR